MKDEWTLLIMEHDEGSKEVSRFFSKIWTGRIIQRELKRDGFQISSKSKKEVLQETKKITKGLDGKILTLYGSGSYHQYTFGFCYHLARKRSEDYLYTHMDNHADDCFSYGDGFHCGGFVMDILHTSEARNLLMVGPSIHDTSGTKLIDQRVLTSSKEDAKEEIKRILRLKAQKDTYVSMDLDILRKEEMKTDFNQGSLGLNHLVNTLEAVQEEKNIISADIVGYSGACSRPHLRPVSLLGYAALAAKITGKETDHILGLQEYFLKLSFRSVEKLNKKFKKATRELRI